MTLHGDLLEQALHLATREPKRPKQASLRRSVSASYYALFHLLVDAGVRRFVSGDSGREPLRHVLRRTVIHSHMKEVAVQFAGGTLKDRLKAAIGPLAIQTELRDVARTFADLQDHRHAADYDLARTFTRFEVLGYQADAQEAFNDWAEVQRSLQADTFLVALLAYGGLRAR